MRTKKNTIRHSLSAWKLTENCARAPRAFYRSIVGGNQLDCEFTNSQPLGYANTEYIVSR